MKTYLVVCQKHENIFASLKQSLRDSNLAGNVGAAELHENDAIYTGYITNPESAFVSVADIAMNNNEAKVILLTGLLYDEKFGTTWNDGGLAAEARRIVEKINTNQSKQIGLITIVYSATIPYTSKNFWATDMIIRKTKTGVNELVNILSGFVLTY